MKIALVGGIYGMPQEYRDRFRITPETTLERGFRELGHQVDVFGHDDVPIYNQYDIVHVHHLGRGAVRAAVDTSTVPLVFTVHSFPRRQNSRGRNEDDLPRSHQLALQFTMRRIDGLIALSSAELRYEESRYKIGGALRRVISNGIPTHAFRRERVDRKNGTPWRLLYVGQLIKNKRVDILLQAVSRLKHPFHLKLAYHSATLEKELMQIADDLGIRESVEFLGGQTALQLAQLYNSTDLFTFPSAFEAFPSVLIEAMLCGTPIVSTNVGGIPELLGEFGRTVPPSDIDAMAAAIDDTLDHYERWYAQSLEMSEQSAACFSVDTMVRHHLDMYRDVIAGSKPRRRHQKVLLPFNRFVRAGVRHWTRAK